MCFHIGGDVIKVVVAVSITISFPAKISLDINLVIEFVVAYCSRKQRIMDKDKLTVVGPLYYSSSLISYQQIFKRLLEWNSSENPYADIFNYDKVLDVQRQKGEFIDTIFDYPEGMCQLVTNGFLTWILDDLKLSRKHLLYYMVIRDYSTTEYAEMMGMTDRNARGIKKTAIKKIQKEFKEALEFIDYMLKPMTIDERYFLEHGPRKKPKKHEK